MPRKVFSWHIFLVNTMKDFLTIKEVANKWDITPRRVQKMCSDGVIAGVEKFGKSWAIPANAKKPRDGRITTGAYKNWRKTSSKNISPEEEA